MIFIKSDREIDLMREAGKILAEVHNEVANIIKAGLTTYEVDEYATKIVLKHHAEPSFYKLYGFPGHFCISINDEVIHGIPSKSRFIKDGDIVKVDGGVKYQGYHSDATRFHLIGNVDPEVRRLAEVTKESFYEALKACTIDNHISDIGKAVETYVMKNGYSVVVDYVGHGIGSDVHEDPDVPNYEMTNKGARLRKNMTLAIEPMVNMGGEEVYTDEKDTWTVRTVDHSISAHFENTILITENGPEILSEV